MSQTTEAAQHEEWVNNPIKMLESHWIKDATDDAARDYIERLEAIMFAGIALYRVSGSRNRDAVSVAETRFRAAMEYFDYFD